MKIDLHVHASERSACSMGTEEQMVIAAREAGLDAICFCDHNRLVPRERVAQLNERFAPFRVFGGVEVSVTALDHCLVLGVHAAALESRDWSYRDLHAFVRSRRGFLVVCHPFRFEERIPFEIDATPGLKPGAVRSGRAWARPGPPDAIELHSVHTSPDDEERIREAAKRVGARLLCNSDAHHPGDVGAYYNELEGEPADEAELVAILKAGEHRCRAREDRGT